jgi:hypothetical protein
MTKAPKMPRRAALMPQARTCSQAEAMDFLRPKLFRDAVEAGWLSPCCVAPNTVEDGSKIYAVADLQNVEDRILNGQYPLKKAR